MKRRFITLALYVVMLGMLLPMQMVQAADPVCEIVGGAQYNSFAEALAAVPEGTASPTIIRMLMNEETYSPISINNKNITLDLNGHTLHIWILSGGTGSETALEVYYGGILTTTGSGALNVTNNAGSGKGIYSHHGGSVNMTGDVESTGFGIGVSATDNSGGLSVTVQGNVSGYIGVGTSNASAIVTGNVSGSDHAVLSDSGGGVSITGDVTGKIEAHSVTIHVVGGVQVTGLASSGIVAVGASTVTVSEDVSAGKQGVNASESSVVTVNGNVTTTTPSSDGGIAALSVDTSARIDVGGKVLSAGQWGVMAKAGGKIFVDGDVQGEYYGVAVMTSAEVEVGGNVCVGTSGGAGINAFEGGKATINGEIQTDPAMIFGESSGALVTPTTKEGYLTYSDGVGSYIWLKTSTPTTPTIALVVHDTSHNAVTSASLGDMLHASADLSGNDPLPTGTVSFISYNNISCSGSGVTAGEVTLSAGVADPSGVAILTNNGLSFKARYNGNALYTTGESACVRISTSAYPTVLSLSADTLPNDGATLNGSPDKLVVQFNTDVLHGLPGDSHSADNPENYLLVEIGSNNNFDTQSCGGVNGGLKPDDLQYTINSVSYNAATFTATLSVNDGKALPVGVYRLFVCGTTSITDISSPTPVFLNNHLSDSMVTFTIASSASGTSSADSSITRLPATGFAPGSVTYLSDPVITYRDLGNIWLDIPRLDLASVVVGVPQSNEGKNWDTSWLGDRIGWLNGSAFPGWNGNSVLTGHVWNANNTPGIFLRLKDLGYGDILRLHFYGNVYLYEVRENQLVLPGNPEAALKHESQSWLTLLTCENFDPLDGEYIYRRIVRAVFIQNGEQ